MGQDKAKGWINLERAKIMLLEDQQTGLNIMTQIITAFGCQRFFKCTTVQEAKELIASEELHLIFANANLKESPAYDFISWLRTSNIQPNAFTPVIMVTGHTQRKNVERARDCGANLVLSKPVSPTGTLERIAIISREKRPFVSCATYVGPDRRFHEIEPPDGIKKRYNDPVGAPAEVDSGEDSKDGEAA